MIVKNGVITAGFNDPRPLSNPGQHIHGALDIAGGDGYIYSPVDGIACGFVISRGIGWAPADKPEVMTLPFREYYSDIFGGIIVIEEAKTKRMHILAHIYPTNLLNGNPVQTQKFKFEKYIESKVDSRTPAFLLKTFEIEIKKGWCLAPVGNAGFSTGKHVHWEIHHGWKIDDYSERINPMEYLS